MNTIMQLRKICNHPYMFQQIEVRLRRVMQKLFVSVFFFFPPLRVVDDILIRITDKCKI